MIVFDLKCGQDHVFEAWFRSSEDYERQIAAQLVACPSCGDVHVAKALMAPNIGRKSNQLPELPAGESPIMAGFNAFEEAFESDGQAYNAPPLPAQLQSELDTVLAKVRAHVEENCDYVGEQFAEEARRIHYGEAQNRGIYGEATPEESLELMDEGIDVMPLPYARRHARSDA